MSSSQLYLVPLHFEPRRSTSTKDPLTWNDPPSTNSIHPRHGSTPRTSTINSSYLSSRKSLPLSLGRQTLATWWWSSCPCMGVVTRKPCEQNCRRLARHGRALSKHGMVQISKRGRLRVNGKNSVQLIHINGTSISQQQQQQQQRDGELQLSPNDIITIGLGGKRTRQSSHEDDDVEDGKQNDTLPSDEDKCNDDEDDDDARQPWMRFQLLRLQETAKSHAANIITPESLTKTKNSDWMTTCRHRQSPTRKRARCLFPPPPKDHRSMSTANKRQKKIACADECSLSDWECDSLISGRRQRRRRRQRPRQQALRRNEHQQEDSLVDSDKSQSTSYNHRRRLNDADDDVAEDSDDEAHDVAIQSNPPTKVIAPHSRRRLYLSPPSALNHRTNPPRVNNADEHRANQITTREKRASIVTPSLELRLEPRKRQTSESSSKVRLPVAACRRQSTSSSTEVLETKMQLLMHEGSTEAALERPEQQQADKKHIAAETSEQMVLNPRPHLARRRLLFGGEGKNIYLKPSPPSSRIVNGREDTPAITSLPATNESDAMSRTSVPCCVHKPTAVEGRAELDSTISRLTTTEEEQPSQRRFAHLKDSSPAEESKRRSNSYHASQHGLVGRPTNEAVAVDSAKGKDDEPNIHQNSLSQSTCKLLPPTLGMLATKCQNDECCFERVPPTAKECQERHSDRHSLSQSTCALVPKMGTFANIQLPIAEYPFLNKDPSLDERKASNGSSPLSAKFLRTTTTKEQKTFDEEEDFKATSAENTGVEGNVDDYSSLLSLPQCHSSSLEDSERIHQQPVQVVVEQSQQQRRPCTNQKPNATGTKVSSLTFEQWTRLADSTTPHDVPIHIRALARLVIAKNLTNNMDGKRGLWFPPLLEGTVVQPLNQQPFMT